MLARAQQLTTLVMLSLASAALLWSWQSSALLALILFAVTALSYSLVLALQFSTLRQRNHDDATPLASKVEVWRAWLIEVSVAACVFFWWQPFCSAYRPDRLSGLKGAEERRGIILVHGFLCNRAAWSRWLKELEGQHNFFIALNLEPVFGTIDRYVDALDDAVVALSKATGRQPLLVCHSMGGLVARAWVRDRNGASRIHHVVTIGSPHHGTSVAEQLPLPTLTKNAMQMRRGSDWLKELEDSENGTTRRKFTCYYSNCDNIVTPASSAALSGADNRFVRGVPHLALLLDTRIMREALSML